MLYKIGTFSKYVDLSIDTIRFYEKEGLLKTQRNQNNQRVYSDSDIAWIKFIKRLKRTGMPIKEIKVYSDLRYQGNSTINERLTLLLAQKNRLTEQRNKIDDHITFLEKKIETYEQQKKLINFQNKN